MQLRDAEVHVGVCSLGCLGSDAPVALEDEPEPLPVHGRWRQHHSFDALGEPFGHLSIASSEHVGGSALVGSPIVLPVPDSQHADEFLVVRHLRLAPSLAVGESDPAGPQTQLLCAEDYLLPVVSDLLVGFGGLPDEGDVVPDILESRGEDAFEGAGRVGEQLEPEPAFRVAGVDGLLEEALHGFLDPPVRVSPDRVPAPHRLHDVDLIHRIVSSDPVCPASL